MSWCEAFTTMEDRWKIDMGPFRANYERDKKRKATLLRLHPLQQKLLIMFLGAVYNHFLVIVWFYLYLHL